MKFLFRVPQFCVVPGGTEGAHRHSEKHLNSENNTNIKNTLTRRFYYYKQILRQHLSGSNIKNIRSWGSFLVPEAAPSVGEHGEPYRKLPLTKYGHLSKFGLF